MFFPSKRIRSIEHLLKAENYLGAAFLAGKVFILDLARRPRPRGRGRIALSLKVESNLNISESVALNRPHGYMLNSRGSCEPPLTSPVINAPRGDLLAVSVCEGGSPLRKLGVVHSLQHTFRGEAKLKILVFSDVSKWHGYEEIVSVEKPGVICLAGDLVSDGFAEFLWGRGEGWIM